jgi:hypothetical protein
VVGMLRGSVLGEEGEADVMVVVVMLETVTEEAAEKAVLFEASHVTTERMVGEVGTQTATTTARRICDTRRSLPWH